MQTQQHCYKELSVIQNRTERLFRH